MGYRQRLLWMTMASLMTTAIVYYVTDLTVALVRGLSGNIANYVLMIFISMLGLMISNVPALLLMWWRKYPNAVLVSLLAAMQGFLISYVLIPLVSSTAGFGYWALSMFISILAGYFIVDGVINMTHINTKSKVISIGLILVGTALFVADFITS